MKHIAPLGLAFASVISFATLGAGCGGGDTGFVGAGGTPSSTSSTGDAGGPSTSSTSTGPGSTSTGDTTSTTTTSTTTGSTTSSTTSTGSGGGSVADPSQPGPYTIAEIDDTIASVSGGDTNLAVHAAYPTAGPSAGPYPVIVFAHGFQISSAAYKAYLQHLATFGYVALTVEFPTSFLGNDNPAEAKDLVAGIDWAKNKAALKADASTAGMSGHSLGGKLALLAATLDARVKAAIELDPVDGGANGCSPPKCVTVADLMPSVHIPTGFLGETTDAMGGFMPCAPAADNYTTFYAKTNAPSLEVTVLGANHVSFVPDQATCGFACGVCQTATLPQAKVLAMANGYLVAFYERHLRGNTGYDTYLTGAQAQALYVSTNEATITSK